MHPVGRRRGRVERVREEPADHVLGECDLAEPSVRARAADLPAAGHLVKADSRLQRLRDVPLQLPEQSPKAAVSVEQWFKESRADVTVDPDPFKDWLRKYEPEVIISKGSFVLPQLQRLGRRIPADLAFVDVFLTDFTGRTAGVRQNHETVGALAVEILAAQLQHNKFGVPEIPTTTFVEGTWFDGASCPMPFRSRACKPASRGRSIQ
jgi:LacI family transcriptional regulator